MFPQAIGSYGSGLMDIEELGQVERCSLPGSGSCGKYHQCSVSSMQCIINAVYHQCSVSSMQCIIINAVYHQCSVSSMQCIINAVYHQCSVSSMQCIIINTVCQDVFLCLQVACSQLILCPQLWKHWAWLYQVGNFLNGRCQDLQT